MASFCSRYVSVSSSRQFNGSLNHKVPSAASPQFLTLIAITQPVLILVVGSAGLASNIVGLVLFHDHGHGGHAHSHGEAEPNGHSHTHDIEPGEPHSHAHEERPRSNASSIR